MILCALLHVVVVLRKERGAMKDQERLETIFHNYGAKEFKWIDPRDIVTAQWVLIFTLNKNGLPE
jgi:hypothetical protein